MKEIGTVSVDDSYYNYRFFFKNDPKILYIKHEGVSLTFYYEISDDIFNGDIKEYQFIVFLEGSHIGNEYEYVGCYEDKNLTYFIYMKKL